MVAPASLVTQLENRRGEARAIERIRSDFMVDLPKMLPNWLSSRRFKGAFWLQKATIPVSIAPLYCVQTILHSMAVIKVACPKCGQKVSGDESFVGSEVECPVCSAPIRFPGKVSDFVDEAVLPSRTTGPVPVPPEHHVPIPPEQPAYQASPDLEVENAVQKQAEVEEPETEDAPRRRERRSSRDFDDDQEVAPSPVFGAISIVSAILVVVSCFTLGIIFAPIAIIAGHTALAKAKHSPVQPAPGHTLGAIGLMVGYVGLAITILLLGAWAFFADPIREFIQQLGS